MINVSEMWKGINNISPYNMLQPRINDIKLPARAENCSWDICYNLLASSVYNFDIDVLLTIG